MNNLRFFSPIKRITVGEIALIDLKKTVVLRGGGKKRTVPRYLLPGTTVDEMKEELGMKK